MTSTYETAKTLKAALEAELNRHCVKLEAYPRNAIGLTADAIKFSAEYQADKKAADKAFRNLRAFNAFYTQAYGAEIMAERRAKRAS